jgi:hypothetical protein
MESVLKRVKVNVFQKTLLFIETFSLSAASAEETREKMCAAIMNHSTAMTEKSDKLEITRSKCLQYVFDALSFIKKKHLKMFNRPMSSFTLSEIEARLWKIFMIKFYCNDKEVLSKCITESKNLAFYYMIYVSYNAKIKENEFKCLYRKICDEEMIIPFWMLYEGRSFITRLITNVLWRSKKIYKKYLNEFLSYHIRHDILKLLWKHLFLTCQYSCSICSQYHLNHMLSDIENAANYFLLKCLIRNEIKSNTSMLCANSITYALMYELENGATLKMPLSWQIINKKKKCNKVFHQLQERQTEINELLRSNADAKNEKLRLRLQRCGCKIDSEMMNGKTSSFYTKYVENKIITTNFNIIMTNYKDIESLFHMYIKEIKNLD